MLKCNFDKRFMHLQNVWKLYTQKLKYYDYLHILQGTRLDEVEGTPSSENGV